MVLGLFSNRKEGEKRAQRRSGLKVFYNLLFIEAKIDDGKRLRNRLKCLNRYPSYKLIQSSDLKESDTFHRFMHVIDGYRNSSYFLQSDSFSS